eukprot:tig00000889_g5295.t1
MPQLLAIPEAPQVLRGASASAEELGAAVPSPAVSGDAAGPSSDGPPMDPRAEFIGELLRLPVEKSAPPSSGAGARPHADASLAWKPPHIIGGELLALALLVGASSLWLRKVLKWVHRRVRTNRTSFSESFLAVLVRPIQIVVWTLASCRFVEVGLHYLKAEALQQYVGPVRGLGFVVACNMLALGWWARWSETRLGKVSQEKEKDKGKKSAKKEEALRVERAKLDGVGKAISVVVWLLSVLCALQLFGVHIGGLVTVTGIGSVIVGLGGRDLIQNFFGGIMIYFSQPFSVGEVIQSIPDNHKDVKKIKFKKLAKLRRINDKKKLWGIDGTVEEIGWLQTRIRSFEKRPIYVPNSLFSSLVVVNSSRMSNRRIRANLRLRHEDVGKVKDIVADIRTILRKHPALDDKQHRIVFFDAYDEYSLNILVSAFTKTTIYEEFMNVKQEILLMCHEILRKHGAELALSTGRVLTRPAASSEYYSFSPLPPIDVPANEFLAYEDERAPGAVHGPEREAPRRTSLTNLDEPPEEELSYPEEAPAPPPAPAPAPAQAPAPAPAPGPVTVAVAVGAGPGEKGGRREEGGALVAARQAGGFKEFSRRTAESNAEYAPDPDEPPANGPAPASKGPRT